MVCCGLLGAACQGKESLPADQSSAQRLDTRPVVSVIDAALEKTPVVLIGEFHGWAEEHAFFRELLAEPLLRQSIDDVVVEFGNARFQHVIDAYVRGEPVPHHRLRRVWSETTQGPSGWQSPDYKTLFQAVRANEPHCATRRETASRVG